jgi:hypothetical protein
MELRCDDAARFRGVFRLVVQVVTKGLSAQHFLNSLESNEFNPLFLPSDLAYTVPYEG